MSSSNLHHREDLLSARSSAHLQSHQEACADHLLNTSEPLRQCSPEQRLYQEYIEAGEPHGPALYAVKGEHWNGVCPDFLDFVNGFKLTRQDMGYAECGYGIQRHRDAMKRHILKDHHLASRRWPEGMNIEVGCLAMTTRMAMYDLAKVAVEHSDRHFPGVRPVALIPSPGWDYRGIFKDVGFDIVYLPLRPENGWMPDLEEWMEVIAEVRGSQDARIALAVSNPQHNPTGMQWPYRATDLLLGTCAEESAYLLIDDAYYGVHDPRVPVENALKKLLESFAQGDGDNELTRAGMFDRWVVTRPFGKQFSCNTMGVAAITTSGELLAALARKSWINRYHCNTHNAEIMCAWLETPQAEEWTISTGLFYARQKDGVRKVLNGMGWPDGSVCTGPSTSYMLFEIPRVYHGDRSGIDRFRDELFYATGTLTSGSLFNQTGHAPYVRLHLGSHYDVIDEFLRRWKAAGLRYDQPEPFPGRMALGKPLPGRALRQQAIA